MMSTTGNTISGEALLGYIERIETLRDQKSAIGDDERVIMAEAKANGFTPKAINYCIKQRAKRPHDRAEDDALRDMYMHAIGLGEAPPLFRFAGLMDVDITARDQVIDALKHIVPAKGQIVITSGSKSIRLFRDKKGEPQSEEVKPAAAAPPKAPGGFQTAKPDAPPPPEVDETGAQALGREAYQGNQPITSNPFPFGHEWRPVWDAAWRAASGTDGMGPDDDDDD